ncbi:thiamine-phosphate kinase [Oecophyllibacter saccharovorans]|uniref:Thiamine-monophosphate kinase n=2 Tax=Oecophyllibacter saccharovorans TaxID=2558360 RepID=A0A506UQR7_9PROT|nr:thiamine-phosphate kinase [Oecophyllibacter saccharovorans]
MMGEFDFIGRHFRPLSGEGAYDLRNDGAILRPASGHELVVSSDTMVENRHFLPGDPPETVGQKLLRCNLSDLAAMGAKPVGYTLNVTLDPQGPYGEKWFSEFARGLQKDQALYGLSLLGGDTTSTTGPLVLSMTVFGEVPVGQALRRDRAQPGDEVWVTGQLGNGALGLQVRTGKLSDPSGELVRAYQLPTPRLGLDLFGIVTTAMDISDGVIQDAGHIAEESGVKLVLDERRFPYSPAGQAAGEAWHETRLLGGDDYELLMTVPPHRISALKKICATQGIPVTSIGKVEQGTGVDVLGTDGLPLKLTRTGWQHF